MSKKDFMRGVETASKANEAFMRKQAAATEALGKRIVQKIDAQGEIIDVVLDELSAQEKKRIYDLNTVVDISDLDETEKEYLCSIVYAVAKLDADLTDEQKAYLRTLKSYLKIVNIQANISLASIENIENIKTQKAIIQTIMEYLFLKYENHDYMDDYEELFDCFSVNRRGIREIQNEIDEMYELIGVEGIAEHYGSVKKVSIEQGHNLSKADLNLRQKAVDAYLRYDMKTAFPLFELLTEQGDDRSCYFLGQIYEYGYQGVVLRDIEKAVSYRKKGADAGDILCQLLLAEATDDRTEKELIIEGCYELVLSLAQSGDVYAMVEIGRLYEFGYDKIKSLEKAEYWYTSAAEKNYWRAFNNLGNLHYTNKTYPKALIFYQKAADMGMEAGMSNLAICYYNGNGVAVDNSKAKMLCKQAAELGFPYAQCMMGELCFADQKYDEAVTWYKKATLNGQTNWYYNLADAYYRSIGIDFETKDNQYRVDYDDEPRYLTKYDYATLYLLYAVEAGDERAILELCGRPVFLGSLLQTDKLKHFNGQITILDRTFPFERIGEFDNEFSSWADKLILKKAEEGNATAQYYWGMKKALEYLYANSSGMTEAMAMFRDSKPEAIKWLNLAKGKVFAPNLEKTLKCLKKFLVFNFPDADKFVDLT